MKIVWVRGLLLMTAIQISKNFLSHILYKWIKLIYEEYQSNKQNPTVFLFLHLADISSFGKFSTFDFSEKKSWINIEIGFFDETLIVLCEILVECWYKAKMNSIFFS